MKKKMTTVLVLGLDSEERYEHDFFLTVISSISCIHNLYRIHRIHEYIQDFFICSEIIFIPFDCYSLIYYFRYRYRAYDSNSDLITSECNYIADLITRKDWKAENWRRQSFFSYFLLSFFLPSFFSFSGKREREGRKEGRGKQSIPSWNISMKNTFFFSFFFLSSLFLSLSNSGRKKRKRERKRKCFWMATLDSRMTTIHSFLLSFSFFSILQHLNTWGRKKM